MYIIFHKLSWQTKLIFMVPTTQNINSKSIKKAVVGDLDTSENPGGEEKNLPRLNHFMREPRRLHPQTLFLQVLQEWQYLPSARQP